MNILKALSGLLKALSGLLSLTSLVKRGTPISKSKSRMMKRRAVYKPFDYPHFIQIAKDHEKIHWTEDEIKLDGDVRDWKTDRMTDAEKYQVTEVLKLFTQQDMTVAGFYEDVVIPYFRNNDVLMAVFSFVAREMIHIRAYALLNDTLGLPESDYSAFVNEKALAEKIDFAMQADPTTIEGMALSLVKSVINEGLSLFGSFVPLLNYQRRGLMKGMGTVVEWSIRDESCLSRDTQVLTDKGWKFVEDVTEADKLAQFDMETHESSFAKPLHYIRHHHKGIMKHFHSGKGSVDMLVTPDHDMVVFNEFNGKTYKVKAEDVQSESHIQFFAAQVGDDASMTFTKSACHKTSDVEYDDEVFCFTMPKGTLVTRRNGVINVTGNCHANTITLMFREWVSEHPWILTDSFKKRVYDMFREAIHLEDAFVDKIYEMGPVEGLSKEDLKTYLRYLADFRLLNLGFKANWNIKENPVEWLDWVLIAPDHSNFFEKRSTEYEINTAVGEIDYGTFTGKQPKIQVFGWYGCKFCEAAKTLLDVAGLKYQWKNLDTKQQRSDFFDELGLEGKERTAPQIYIGDVRIGGYDALRKYLKAE